MASGEGKRFGGNKLMAQFRGRPMIEQILDATEGFSRRVVVTRSADVEKLCKNRRIPVILHDRPGRNDTVRLGLEAMGAVEGCLFCPGDQPLLTRETVEAMARAAGDSILRLSYGDTVGTPVYFPNWCFEELKELPQGAGGSVLIPKYPHRVQAVPARAEEELWDVDTPEDLEQIKNLSF